MFEQRPIETTLYSLKADNPPQPHQRRTGKRHLSLLRVGTLKVASRSELCLVRNVSAGGMMVRVYSHLAEGERLTIELKQGEPLGGTVRWVEDGCIGVHFDEPVDVIRLISTSLEGPRPRMPRIGVDRLAWLRETDGPRVRARIADISQGGARVETASQLAVGAHVIVLVEGLAPQQAVVRWREDGCFGLTFNRIIALPDLVHWLQLDEAPARTGTG